MNDEQFKRLLELDPDGVPSLTEVTKEVMRGPDVRGSHVSDEVERTYTRTAEAGDRSYAVLDSVVNPLPADEPPLGWEEPSVNSFHFAAEITPASFDENACQSGPDDYMERRQRDRSGNKPKVRKWKNREKTKAARKARRNNR